MRLSRCVTPELRDRVNEYRELTERLIVTHMNGVMAFARLTADGSAKSISPDDPKGQPTYFEGCTTRVERLLRIRLLLDRLDEFSSERVEGV